MTASHYLRLNEKDNIVISVNGIAAGQSMNVDSCEVVAQSDIPVGHKVAICAIAMGESVIKHGVPIGMAKVHISPGHHVHTHNLVSTYIAPYLS